VGAPQLLLADLILHSQQLPSGSITSFVNDSFLVAGSLLCIGSWHGQRSSSWHLQLAAVRACCAQAVPTVSTACQYVLVHGWWLVSSMPVLWSQVVQTDSGQRG
jgi:hypothetical protein